MIRVGHTVLLTISMGFLNVWFQGPRKRSGGVTGQYWHPASGSVVIVANTRRVTL